jgi:hypothetical protein
MLLARGTNALSRLSQKSLDVMLVEHLDISRAYCRKAVRALLVRIQLSLNRIR